MNENSAPHKIYQHYESAIIEGSLRAGDRLPSERQLAQKFGVSRTSVRAAVLALNAKGWILSQPGGGHYVSQRLQQDMAEPLLKILNSSPEAHFDLLEFRYSIEGDCAYNAALRANELDLKALERSYRNLQISYQQPSIDAQSKADAQFHLAIAEASHNLIYLHLVSSLLTALSTNMHSSISKMFENKMTRDTLMHQHSAIFDAIISRQPSVAKEAAHQHIRYVEGMLQQVTREEYRQERSQRRHFLD